MKDNKSAYVFSFILTFVLFAVANIIDQISGHSDHSRGYPLFIFIAWTAVVATFLYLGWKLIYIINAIVFYLFQVYAVFFHEPSQEMTRIQWLIGTLPLPMKYMLFVPILFLISIIAQFILYRIQRNKLDEENEYEYVYEDEDEDEDEDDDDYEDELENENAR